MLTSQPSGSSFWNTRRGEFLLQYLLPTQVPVIRSKHRAQTRSAAPSKATHQWVAARSMDACFRARCPNCGIVREYDPRGDQTWVSYSSYGEFLAHGELGRLDEPDCEALPASSAAAEEGLLLP